MPGAVSKPTLIDRHRQAADVSQQDKGETGRMVSWVAGSFPRRYIRRVDDLCEVTLASFGQRNGQLGVTLISRLVNKPSSEKNLGP